ncbi:tRNA (adenosine(37)-N6)-threonylcarbamoyltransferase complex ATPase subunit type 1 TsaE [Pseudoalteromonas luteoviolacea]|uniref:tRNA (adenosine(37)-N6)-threonylcarbamoyltransferase complex ATPase subunit type 1 TsaE n=1 Tax=Pseudoalteromonas luteoviolacea TaxID=43657 RepID=UPI0011522DAD|nr:tRNA (adenosine(37)-N6)-threonylcarbamoyltransferase complex ATPase subunit type 1 TsaE [Pseudoalteromonas luteoviolacea]TQF66610.1 tRNA (adenosine(37)-N6)-threonylcarbamoyltransferase complex ATPase subunit type 1 TsaE [Pseudoalteromonas luteoviolacea]
MSQNDTLQLSLADEDATIALGRQLASSISEGAVFYMHGDLGAGKTTMTRGLVQGLGHVGNVKSPTYTLVEPYELPERSVYHFDLYRLGDPEELEFMGIRDYFSTQAVCIVEWPEKGHGYIPNPDIDVYLAYEGDARSATLKAHSERGKQLLATISSYA